MKFQANLFANKKLMTSERGEKSRKLAFGATIITFLLITFLFLSLRQTEYFHVILNIVFFRNQ